MDNTQTNLLQRLARLDACAVSDALDQLGIQGVAHGLAQLTVPHRISGRAVTVRIGADDGRVSKRHLCTAAVEASDGYSIIVIEHNGRVDVAGWGGILSVAAMARGVQGVIIDGACRDLDQSRELGLPIYGRAAVPVTARGRVIELDWNVPITISGVSVAPGDLVLADGSGVVLIPQTRAENVVARAEQVVQKEHLMELAVRGGKAVSTVMGADYESMLKDGDA